MKDARKRRETVKAMTRFGVSIVSKAQTTSRLMSLLRMMRNWSFVDTRAITTRARFVVKLDLLSINLGIKLEPLCGGYRVSKWISFLNMFVTEYALSIWMPPSSSQT
uniref:Uncharacterized protein n=1 Tax=Arabidopsis thaliana TaxID=3702 RepID=Q5Q0J1_ARATH|nr:hypothetical protein AT1G03710 [Arabidopsis thaliana]